MWQIVLVERSTVSVMNMVGGELEFSEELAMENILILSDWNIMASIGDSRGLMGCY